MKIKPITRVVSLMFSCFFFFLSVIMTISISLAIFDPYESQNVFLQWVLAIVAIYKFSSFLLPIILLYASIILFMPGWTKHSKATLIASPFCFFTSVAGEYSLYTFLPIIQNPTIASFAKWAIVLITLLLICIEFMIAHFIAIRFFKNYRQEINYQCDVDIIADEYSGDKFDKATEKTEQTKEEPKETFFSLFKFEDEKDNLEQTRKEDSSKENESSIDASNIIEDNVETDGIKETSEIPIEDTPSITEEEFEEKELEEVQNIESQDISDQNVRNNQDINNIEEIEKTIEQTLKKIDDVIKEDVKLDDGNAFEYAENKIENIEDFISDKDVSEDDFNDELQEKASEEEIIENKVKDDILESMQEVPTTNAEDGAVEEVDDETEEKTDVVENNEKEERLDDIINDDEKTRESINETERAEIIGTEKRLDVNEVQNSEEAYIKEELKKIEKIEATSFKPLVASSNEKNQGYNIPFDLLTEYPGNDYWIIDSSTRQAAFRLKSTLNEFKINVEITGIRKGPVVTMFEVLPPPGIKLTKITALQDNIALRLAAESVRIVAPIPGKRAVGIEIPNDKRSIVGFRELIQVENPEAKKMAIPIVLGKDITGEPQTIDLAQTPHLLIAGATGAGKSVCVNSIILSILYNNKPNEVKLLLVDPKIVELKLYNDIGHLLTPVITEPKKAFQALQYCICEMERRYAFLDKMSVRDIKSYNRKIRAENLVMERLPYIVIIIDEFADLMATTGKELEGTVSRLCAMSRAVGIHLVLATQRPSADVITGLIKANIPSRIAFMVASRVDSRIILDDGGADKLLGKGDMLYVSPAKPWPTRIQGAFVSEEEVERVVERVKSFGEPDYIDDEIFIDEAEETPDSFFGDESDPLYDEAVDIVLHEGKASASYIQRRLKIGYNRAARIIEEMEERGVVGPANGSKPRDILQSY